MTEATTADIHRSVSVPVDPDAAFRIFTEEIGAWWPLARFSLGGDAAVSAHVEPRVGGRIFERGRDGSEQSWATITAWEPPRRFTATWQLSEDEGPTDLVVEFTPAGDGTRVDVTHGGWERHEGGAASRDNYDRGWDFLLGQFAQRAA